MRLLSEGRQTIRTARPLSAIKNTEAKHRHSMMRGTPSSNQKSDSDTSRTIAKGHTHKKEVRIGNCIIHNLVVMESKI